MNVRLRRRQTAQWARFVRAAEQARDHAEHLAEQSPQAADATDDTELSPHGGFGISGPSRTASASPVSAGRKSGCSVTVLADRRKP